MNPGRIKILGAYLLAMGLLQMCLYLAMSRWTEEFNWLFYFDPRLGVLFLETVLRKNDPHVPSLLRWSLAAWTLLLGGVLFSGRRVVKLFVVSELILVLTNLFFFLYTIREGLHFSHGFSIGELFFPLLVMVLFSFVPLWLAWRSRAKSDAI